MSAPTLTELTDTAHLDWHALACELRREGCPHAAAWWSICLHCHAHTPACDKCRREFARVVAFLAGLTPLGCASCGALIDPARPGDLFTFVPIGD